MDRYDKVEAKNCRKCEESDGRYEPRVYLSRFHFKSWTNSISLMIRSRSTIGENLATISNRILLIFKSEHEIHLLVLINR